MSQMLLTQDKAGELKTAAPGITFLPAFREKQTAAGLFRTLVYTQ